MILIIFIHMKLATNCLLFNTFYFKEVIKSMLPAMLFFFIYIPVWGQHDVTDGVDQQKRNQWIKSNVRQLKKLKHEKCTKSIEPRVVEGDDYHHKSYRLVNYSGCISFPNGDWIHLISSSMHDNPEIGDITLAIDQNLRIFANEGHVCGGIINFYISSDSEINSSQAFFELFASDCDDCRWKLLENK